MKSRAVLAAVAALSCMCGILTACPGGQVPVTSPATCSVNQCPPDAYTMCEADKGIVLKQAACCHGNTVAPACVCPSGQIAHSSDDAGTPCN